MSTAGVLQCFRNLVLFSWLSSEGGDGDSAVAVLQMRSRGKEELLIDFFQVVSLKCMGPGLYFPKLLVFTFKHIPVMSCTVTVDTSFLANLSPPLC